MRITPLWILILVEELIEIGYLETKLIIDDLKRELEKANIILRESSQVDRLDIENDLRDLKHDRFDNWR